MSSEEMISPRDELKRLEAEKNKLLEVVQKLNHKIKYKELELKALGPIIEQYKSIDVGPIRRRLNAIEFKISTQASTPKKERDLVKKAKEFRKEYNDVMKIEKVRKRKGFIENDLKELMRERDKIDAKLKELRAKIKSIVEDLREARKKAQFTKGKRGKGAGNGKKGAQAEDMYITLEDIVEIEKKKP